MDVLKKKLPNAVTWSNGNVFRSLTLLAATSCEVNGETPYTQLQPAPASSS